MRIALAIFSALILSASAGQTNILGQAQGRMAIGSDGVAEFIANDIAAPLIQWLPFHEAETNGAWYDAWDSRIASNGTTGPAWVTNAGGAASFNGSNTWIITGLNSNDYNGKTSVAVMQWVYVRGHNNTNQLNNCIFSSLSSGGNTIILQLHLTSNRITVFSRSISSDSLQSIYSPTFTQSNTWCLVGASLNVSSKVVSCWLNGGMISNATRTYAASVITVTNFPTDQQVIGGSYISSIMSRHINAYIGDSYFFTNELSAAQATNLWNATRARYGL